MIRIPPPEPLPVSETHDILPAVLKHTSARGALVWRENSGLYYTPSASGFRRVRASIPGCSDIVGLVSLSVARLQALGILRIGAFLGVETKTPTGRLRESQLEFRSGILSRDGLCVVARCPEDVDSAIGGLLG